MFYQKTWDGMLATQVEIRHVVWGEILWCGMKGATNTTVVALALGAMSAMGVVDLRTSMLVVAPPLALACGLVFGAFGLIFTALVPSIDHMNYPTFLVGIPLGFVSDTFFPLDPSSPALQVLLDLNPIRHLARTLRGLLLGTLQARDPLLLLLTIAVTFVLLSALAHRLVRRRIVG
jgi:lipooligosaccharide transport system permease protein